MVFKKGNQINKGRKLTEEHKEKIRSYRHTEEAKNKIRGRRPWNYIDGRSKLITTVRYGDDWEAIRLLIYKRDNYSCQKCAEKMSKIPFHIHHKIPFSISFDNSPKNLITLCPPCHREVEAVIMRELKNQKVEV